VNKKAYLDSYLSLLEKAASTNTQFECHVLLNTLLLSLNDNHSRIYGTEVGATEAIRNDSGALETFKKSDLFNAYPKPKIDLDSLAMQLKDTPVEAVEGIYEKNGVLTLAVYREKDDTIYKALVLQSGTALWERGEQVFTFIPFGNEYLLGVGGSLSSKRHIAYTERIANGFFHFMGFQKEVGQINYATEVPFEETYYREELSNDITYLKIGSFNSWNPTLGEAEAFYKSLEGRLTKPHLIVDLRNNGGGGDRNSDILFKLLKDHSKENMLYVLINHRTVSNAEQVALKLGALKNCILFGMQTNGTLTYEIKDSSYPLPCGRFTAVLTSKKHARYLEYESQGIAPDIPLNRDTDWLEQVTNYIEESSTNTE
jgi:hypothetical protein